MRTFQRRVSAWRGLNVSRVAILEQAHRPGEVMQTNGTWLNDLGLTVQGEPLKVILIHCVLVYSNWEWGCLARSESLGALQLTDVAPHLNCGYVALSNPAPNLTL